ncbi:MAG TPA: site-2 protease family protein, partial [Dehalococcoidia bacterium]|nr:site-2 protease family protein [Dehalococcoidia bacterium]
MVLFDAILPFLGILVVLIVVHELGHYITAKLCGVRVLEAGLGYPPRLWGF